MFFLERKNQRTFASWASAWQSGPWVEVVLRVVLFAGFASFIAFWLIEAWLQAEASAQPTVASGVYQHPHPFKCQVRFLTDRQAAAAQIANILACGWGFAAVAGVWLATIEALAAKQRKEDLSRPRPSLSG